MIKRVPKELIGFSPPDYELEGFEVLEMIKDMPEKINIPINRELNLGEIYNAKMRAKIHPERIVPPLDEVVTEVLYYAVQEIYKMFKARNNCKKHKKKESIKVNYSILKYNVLLSIHTDYDIGEFSFCPVIENWLEGPVYDLGVNFYFTLSGHELLETYYMR